MKYPKSFTLADRDDGFTVEVTYDAMKNVYLAEYGDGVPEHYSEDEITGLIACSYDIQYTYPDNFSFTHDTTSQLYDLVKIPNLNKWACYQDGSTHGATYTGEEIAHHFKEGHWRGISNAEPVERDLVFPFTVRCDEGVNYRITKSDTDGKVDCYDIEGDEWWYGLFTEDDCRQYIEGATWIVTSVGPQAKAVQAPPEPSKEVAKPLDSLTIKVSSEGFTEATEQSKKLAQAIEEVNIALESFQAIFEDTRELLGHNAGDMVTFCCEAE